MAECVKHKSRRHRARERCTSTRLDAYFKADNNKRKERNEAYTKALERILYKYPGRHRGPRACWPCSSGRTATRGTPISSFLAIDALLDQVFKADPMHPAHHYRIHLWDQREGRERPRLRGPVRADRRRASPTCGTCRGTSIRKTKRYDDACWQQEASARVDHAHMMRDRVLPDQIHNFAHNNEWLIRDMIFVGRMRDAIDLAKNMCELPRHPKYNTARPRAARTSAGCGCSSR